MADGLSCYLCCLYCPCCLSLPAAFAAPSAVPLAAVFALPSADFVAAFPVAAPVCVALAHSAVVAAAYPAVFVARLFVVARLAVLPSAALPVVDGGVVADSVAPAAARHLAARTVDGRWLPAGCPRDGSHWDCLRSAAGWDSLRWHWADWRWVDSRLADLRLAAGWDSLRWHWAGWRSVDSRLADLRLAAGWDSLRWHWAGWRSVDSRLADLRLDDSGSQHLAHSDSRWPDDSHWVARSPADSADLVAQGARCFDFAQADQAVPGGSRNYPLLVTPPFSQELQVLRLRARHLVDCHESGLPPQDGHRLPLPPLLAVLLEPEEEAARFLRLRYD